MTLLTRIRSAMKRQPSGLPLSMLRDKRGNFAVMTALLLPVGLGLAGLAIDTTEMITAKAALQNAADAAALAGATAMANDKATPAAVQALALDFIKGQMANHATSEEPNADPFDYGSCTHVTATEKPGVGQGKIYEVAVETCQHVAFTAFSSFLGQDSTTVHVKSVTEASTENRTAVSMYLVLDRSGSMGEYTDTVKSSSLCKQGKKWVTCTVYYTKIEALRMAATNLMDKLTVTDPTKTYVRTGAISYNDYTQSPTNLAWGETNAKTYVSALTASGGTDSTTAFKTGYQALMQASETTAHRNKNGQTPNKVIIFMTDGDNNYTSADVATKSWCDAARNNGVEVYSVAFMAPTRGKALLGYCATTSGHYFAAEDATQLNAAFEYIGQQATKAASRLTQ